MTTHALGEDILASAMSKARISLEAMQKDQEDDPLEQADECPWLEGFWQGQCQDESGEPPMPNNLVITQDGCQTIQINGETRQPGGQSLAHNQLANRDGFTVVVKSEWNESRSGIMSYLVGTYNFGDIFGVSRVLRDNHIHLETDGKLISSTQTTIANVYSRKIITRTSRECRYKRSDEGKEDGLDPAMELPRNPPRFSTKK